MSTQDEGKIIYTKHHYFLNEEGLVIEECYQQEHGCPGIFECAQDGFQKRVFIPLSEQESDFVSDRTKTLLGWHAIPLHISVKLPESDLFVFTEPQNLYISQGCKQ